MALQSTTTSTTVSVTSDSSSATVSNPFITVRIDLPRATYGIIDTKTSDILLADAALGEALSQGDEVKLVATTDVQDALGRGKKLEFSVRLRSLWRHFPTRTESNPPIARLFTFTLYEDRPALILGFGMTLPQYFSMRLMGAAPLRTGRLFNGRPIQDLRTLNGSAGADPTFVAAEALRESLNSLMLTGVVEGRRRSAVWGGLIGRDFAAVATLKEGQISLSCEDPIGRLVDSGETYHAADQFYLDLHTAEPFEALEAYGWAMRLANNAKPGVYDFPVLCGWSVGNISKLPNINNSAKLVEELDHANRVGLTKYTKVAVRLEPDKYHNDTEQGWWDDDHMRRFGHLVAPYDTIAKWSKTLQERNGVPYIYMQLGMPSDDYARAFPQHMLFNDASQVDRQHPNPKLVEQHRKHPHHQPFVTYDYTDNDFARHFVQAWKKLATDGIRGVKIDYPETAWRPEGGFDDRKTSTTSAYRRAFELMREGMGPDGLIDERNLGESNRPCLDVTAGVIDTQRTWADSNKFVPEMVSISGLRWYKNRSVFNYYSDTKAVHNLPTGVLQSLVTMNLLTSGRLDLATSFSLFDPEITHAVSRTYPHYQEPITARPLDAFTGVKHPQVYDLKLTEDWHQLAFFNTGDAPTTVSTGLSGERVDKNIGLDSKSEYHAYEFWTNRYLGKFPGTGRIEYRLDPLHCAMISLHRVQQNPQVISSDRHVLQGWVELSGVKWNPREKTLAGSARVIAGEPLNFVIARNGVDLATAEAARGKISLAAHADHRELVLMTIVSDVTDDVPWTLKAR